MPESSIYLDNNATTGMDPAIAQRMLELQLAALANPASQHRPGREALRLLEDAKNELLELLGAPRAGMEAAQVILTSGGTEANNLAIRGLAGDSGIVIVGGIEHPSVLDAARELGPGRFRCLPVDNDGLCDLEQLRAWLQQAEGRVRLVSIMYGNNETGVVQDLKRVCDLCREFDVPVHTDAVQSAGKIDIDMSQLGLTALSLTAHKLHGPVGIGALILLSGHTLQPLLLGGGQQLGLRPGTEPVVPAVALAMALRLATAARRDGVYARLGERRDAFEAELMKLQPMVRIGAGAVRLPHVANVAFPGIDRQALHMALDFAGIACSTGSACASGSSRPSPVLTAMQLDEATIASSIRFSFSRFTTPQESEQAAQTVARVVNKLRSNRQPLK